MKWNEVYINELLHCGLIDDADEKPQLLFMFIY